MIVFALALLAVLVLWLLLDHAGRSKPANPIKPIAVGNGAAHPPQNVNPRPWGTRLSDYDTAGHLGMMPDGVNWDGKE